MTSGIHHVTAIASEPQRNLDFYSGCLGLRLVKLTVNFDDPGTYHFYFGNENADVGSILTFFPWLGARRGTPGIGQATKVSFSVSRSSLFNWKSYLEGEGIMFVELLRFGEIALGFSDPDGLEIELIGNSEIESDERKILTIRSVELSVAGYEKTAKILTSHLGFFQSGIEGNCYRYSLTSGSNVDIVCLPGGTKGIGGVGTIHHVAFRCPTKESQLEIRNELVVEGYNVSPVIDRKYFHSIYFRESGGVLFEVATDLPGMAIDESLDELGTKLQLPVEYENHRESIESSLPPLVLPK